MISVNFWKTLKKSPRPGPGGGRGKMPLEDILGRTFPDFTSYFKSLQAFRLFGGAIPVGILGKANLLHDCRLPPAIPESSGGEELKRRSNRPPG